MPDAAGRPDKNRADRRSVNINLRATEAWRALVDQAASLMEKTRTDFIVEAARRQAEDILLDQRFFELSEERFKAFENILDNPSMPNDALRKLMNRKAPWQE